jgi:diguanylate cyclase (GGDEF)-like protein/PAS domain S-box-containing protein
LIGSSAPLGLVLEAVCLLADDAVEGSECALLLLDDAGAEITRAIGPALPDEVLSGLAGHINNATPGQLRGASRERRDHEIVLADPLANALDARMRRLGLDLWQALPLGESSSGTPTGVLVLFCDRADDPTNDELTSMREAASLANLALHALAERAATPGEGETGFRHLVEAIPAISYEQRIGETRAVTYISPQVEAILGWSAADYVADPRHWFRHIHLLDQERVQTEVTRAIATRAPFSSEYRVVARNGRVVWMRDKATLVEEDAGGEQRWQGVQFDITAEKTTETQLLHLAFYDSLTGLPNRRLCIDRLQAVLSHPDRPQVALLFIDLDRFKVINDGIGHAAGDELLGAVAQRLAEHVAGHGSLSRFGGDEFVAVLEHGGFGEVEALASSLLGALQRPFSFHGHELIVEGTVGIAVAGPDLATPETLLRAADAALYRAKGSGGGVYAVYDPRIDGQGPDRLERESALRRGLERGEFQIAYQPVVEIESGTMLAVEALLRWNHPERGLLQPSEFIPLADETGLIVPLGKWVIEEACRQMRHWQERFPEMHALQVSVNLSGRQFRHPTLVEDVALVLRETGLAPEHLALEIKEADAFANAAATAATLLEFRRLGVRVTIDDFGKGWSALGSLAQFTIDDLKIDGSRVSRLGREQPHSDIVRALVTMAKAVGMGVTAGAVETGEQLAMLRELGCDRAQGRHLAPPLSASEIEQRFQHEPDIAVRSA